METRLGVIVVALILLPLAVPAGDAVSDFSLKDTDGKIVRLSDYLGQKVIVLNFWATWCAPCQNELPQLQRIWDRYREKDLVILGVATDGPSTVARVKPHAKKLGLTFPILLDRESTVSAQYNPHQQMPRTVVIGKDRTIQFAHDGYAPGDETQLEEKIAGLLGAEGK